MAWGPIVTKSKNKMQCCLLSLLSDITVQYVYRTSYFQYCHSDLKNIAMDTSLLKKRCSSKNISIEVSVTCLSKVSLRCSILQNVLDGLRVFSSKTQLLFHMKTGALKFCSGLWQLYSSVCGLQQKSLTTPVLRGSVCTLTNTTYCKSQNW